MIQLTKSNFAIALDNVAPKQKLSLKYFCASNIVRINGDTIVPIHQTFQNVLEKKYGFALTLSKEEAYKLAVNKYQFFTAQDFESSVWHVTGGNVGQLFEMHRLLQLGKSINETTAEMTKASLRVLNVAVQCEKGPDFDSYTKKELPENKAIKICVRNRQDLLKHLGKCKFAIARERISSDHALSVKHFCAEKVLKDDGLIVAPIHRSMQNGIAIYLSSISTFTRFKSFLNFLTGFLRKE